MVEHCPFKARVLGSSPSRLTSRLARHSWARRPDHGAVPQPEDPRAPLRRGPAPPRAPTSVRRPALAQTATWSRARRVIANAAPRRRPVPSNGASRRWSGRPGAQGRAAAPIRISRGHPFWANEPFFRARENADRSERCNHHVRPWSRAARRSYQGAVPQRAAGHAEFFDGTFPR
jgi:hypothetical protein